MGRKLIITAMFFVAFMSAALDARAETCWGWMDSDPVVGVYVINAGTPSVRWGSGQTDPLDQELANVPEETVGWWRNESNDCPRKHRYTYLGAADQQARFDMWKAAHATRLGQLLAMFVFVCLISLVLRVRGQPAWSVRVALIGGVGVVLFFVSTIDLSMITSGEARGLDSAGAKQQLEQLKLDLEIRGEENRQRAAAERESAEEARRTQLTKEKCADTDACRSHGACGYHEWNSGSDCRAQSHDHCKESESCRVHGNCRLSGSGGGCIATSIADCEASERCETIGACTLLRKRCVPTRKGCERWKACPEPGACVLGYDRCDFPGCEAAASCIEEGRCVLQDGACIATERSCRAWKGCPAPGRCPVEGNVCALTQQACQHSNKCKETGNCHLVDGLCQPKTEKDCQRAKKCRGRKCTIMDFGGSKVCSPIDLKKLFE